MKTTRNMLTVVAMIAAIGLAGGAANADLVTELGILDLTANGGVNPGTTDPWADGDQYRLVFVSSTRTNALSGDIAYYNAHVQAAASSAGLGSVTWNAIASTSAAHGGTATVDARDNTSTNFTVDPVGMGIFLIDGSTIIADNYTDLWDGTIDNRLDKDENGAVVPTHDGPMGAWKSVWAGTTTSGMNRGVAALGGNNRADLGLAQSTTAHWIRRADINPTDADDLCYVYAMSSPLTLTDDSTGPPPVAIAGTDFSNTPGFNDPGGQANLDNVNIDDLDPSDNITVTNWAFAGGGKFEGWDNNAQVGMANSPVTKLNGSGSHAQPNVGDDPPTFNEASFSIDIPADTMVDLTEVTWDWRNATDSTNQRWLAFRTSLDDTLIFSELGLARNNVDAQTIALDDAKYKGLTDQSVTFYWYASGQGSGDIDIDTIRVLGTVGPAFEIPEPATMALLGLAACGLGGYVRLSRAKPRARRRKG